LGCVYRSFSNFETIEEFCYYDFASIKKEIIEFSCEFMAIVEIAFGNFERSKLNKNCSNPKVDV